MDDHRRFFDLFFRLRGFFDLSGRFFFLGDFAFGAFLGGFFFDLGGRFAFFFFGLRFGGARPLLRLPIRP